jgi:hypothetical protein
MDDITKKRFDDIDRRLDNLPKAFAVAFTEAFSNAQAALSRHLDSFREEVKEAADRRHAELLDQMRRQHGEQMRKFQAVIDEAIALREERFARLEARIAKLETSA